MSQNRKFSVSPLAARTALLLSLFCGSAAVTTIASVDTSEDWKMAADIVESIERPDIPDREFLITDFGAKPGGESDARPAILKAISQAVSEGGGRVVLPAGKWLSNGPIHLQSKIDFHVSEGATLLFGADTEDYLPVVLTRWEGTELYGYSPLIYARDVHDVAITGKGLIDGNAESGFHDWTGKQEADQLALREMGAGGTPREERVFGEGTFLRPSMVQIFEAERVLL